MANSGGIGWVVMFFLLLFFVGFFLSGLAIVLGIINQQYIVVVCGAVTFACIAALLYTIFKK